MTEPREPTLKQHRPPVLAGVDGNIAQNRHRLAEPRIARQYWRAWIETASERRMSPTVECIARQYWRAWIETGIGGVAVQVLSAHRPPVLAGVDGNYSKAVLNMAQPAASPASIGGRGLKLAAFAIEGRRFVASPASIGGRGLKPPG